MTSRFAERLRTGPAIVGDGGMGALVTSAVQRLRCPEEANIRAPEAVVSLHVSFINAGAELIETNTFGAGRPKLAALYLEDEFERINSQAVRLAREAREIAGRKEVFIGGSIGPLGARDDIFDEERRALYAEQARILEGRGADLFLVETFYDLDELCSAIEAVRSVSSLPVVAMLTFDEGAQTPAGVSAPDAAERLRPYDLAAIGANHGAGLLSALAALEGMAHDGHPPLAVMPNIGLASLAGGRVVYPHATPEYFAEFAAHARAPRGRADRRLLRDDADRDRRDPLGGRRGAPAARRAPLRGAGARGAGRAPRRSRPASSTPSPRRVGRLGADRPAARRQQRGHGRDGARARRLRRGRVPRHQRQPDGAGPDERADGGGRDRARGRHRDDPAPDPARHDDDGPRVGAARRARGGRPQRARGHGRRAGARRLPGLARRLRGRLDRARAPDGRA